MLLSALILIAAVSAQFYPSSAIAPRDFIQEKLDQHTLSQLTVRLEKAVQQYQWSDTSALESLLDRVERENQKSAPNHARVVNLKEETHYQLEPPSWWTKTKVCFGMKPEGKDNGQCFGPDQPTCAGFNEYTSPYKDRTHNSTGGCQMAWGIQAPDVEDSWFSHVQICFRYKAERFAGRGQCGNGTAKAVCAKVNYMTPFYLDQTNHRPGGCKMSWKLKVPVTSPAWLLNSKVCYMWNCHKNVNFVNLLCAPANHWTSYYLDDSFGCQMQWSLANGYLTA